MKHRTAPSSVRCLCARCGAVPASFQVGLLSGCVDTALSAGQPAGLAAKLHRMLQRDPGSWSVFCGLQFVKKPTTTSLHFASRAGLNALMGSIEPSGGGCSHCTCCRVDTGLLWPPIGLHSDLPGCVPQGLPMELVCCIGCMQPVSRPLALGAAGKRCQGTKFSQSRVGTLRTCISASA